MGDPVWLADALRREGVATVEYGDWKNIGHGDFGNIWGVIVHHTGGNSSAQAIQNHPDLGLCSQIFLNRAGVAHVVGAGIAYHAGSGSWPGIQANNANQVTIGIEAENNGTEGWTPTQYWAYVKTVAAILRHLGLGSDRVIAHKEWAVVQGKWDPGGMDMPKFRRDVQNQLNGSVAPPVNMIDKAAAEATWLGARVGKPGQETVCGKDGKGRFAQFANGYVYWHPSSGAIAVPLNIFQAWAGLGWESGVLGYPIRGHSVLPGGDVQAFQGGVLYRKYGQPGAFVTGKIGDRWAKEGFEKGPLGWPKSNEFDRDGGRAQEFENGTLAWRADGVVKL